MLYDCWRAVAREYGPELALRDLRTQRSYTFAELARAADRLPSSAGPAAFPQGLDDQFILEVLRGWRDNRIVCPLEVGQKNVAHVPPVPRGVIHLKTTSATQGTPRMVGFRAVQLVADVENICSTMGLRPESPNLGVISLAHSYGFSNLVLPLLLKGIPLILVGSSLPEALRSALRHFPGCTLASVPALWRSWHEAGVLSPKVRLAISAGAPLPLSLEQEVFLTVHLKIHNFYGSSECGGIAFDPSDLPRPDPALAGLPLKNVVLNVARNGCLAVRGPAVGQGYYPEPAATLKRGVFRTSDVAEIDNGMIFLRGRAGDRINVAGRKVSPEVIEQVLASHPAVRNCVVFGIPSHQAERGDIVVAAIEVRGDPGTEELKRHVAEHSPAWQIPREWWLLPELRFNQRGKLSRAETRKHYLAFRTASHRRHKPS